MKTLLTAFIFFNTIVLFSQEIIGIGQLKVTITENSNGFELSSITNNTVEVLNSTVSPELFTLFIHNSLTNTDEEINALTGWGSVNVTNSGSNCTIELSNATTVNLPSSLTAIVTINVSNTISDWDLEVTGLGSDCSLMDAIFPQLNIKADGNDNFFYPLYSGQITENPATAIDYFDDASDNFDNSTGIYPRGWGTTMQFLSYYNTNYGLYFGFHDGDASLKQFGVKNENGGVRVQCKTPAENKTINGNDWNYPGVFELDVYEGDWYDAALIYKQWVSSQASYWPTESVSRTVRQHSVGDIGVWLGTYFNDGTVTQMEGYLQTATDFYDFPVGLHTYNWNNYEFDHFYPEYFPFKTNIENTFNEIQTNNNATIMPYVNGRLWDTGLGGGDAGDAQAATLFNTDGIASSAKKSDGSYHAMTFSNNVFATMCPSQTYWQNYLVDVVNSVTSDNDLGAKAVYLDMIGASSAAQCMDPNHGHPLGGGSYWKSGLSDMLNSMHAAIPADRFITVEGGCDFIADEVDGFMVQGWLTKNQVPAWQAIYTGKVQLFGTLTGTSMYDDQRFYGRLSQGFAYGVQTGRQFIWLPISATSSPTNEMASNYTRTLGRMRYKLRDFMSYGEMKRPIDITGTIPDITYDVYDWGGAHGLITLTNPAIRKTVWQNANEVVVLFVNGRIQSPANVAGGDVNFSFDFNPADYGLAGDLTIQELTPTTDGSIDVVDANTFPKNVMLQNLDIVAYKITSTEMVGVNADKFTSQLSIYPNPTSTQFVIDYKNKIDDLTIYNNMGQIVLNSVPNSKTIDVSKLPKGIYFVVIQSSGKVLSRKLIKK